MFASGAQIAAGGAGDDIYLVAQGAQIIEEAGGGYDRVTFAAREFTDDPVEDATLFRVLDNARFAPSGSTRRAGSRP